MVLREHQVTKVIRVPLVFLDFQVWMVYLGTQDLLDPEASLACMVIMVHEAIQGFQEKEEFLAQGATQAFLGKVEKKETQCSF